MICAKNDKTVTKFVKVMPRILWPLFFSDSLYNSKPFNFLESRVTQD